MNLDDISINADDDDSLKKGASNVVSKIRPHWGPASCLKHKIFSDGITNKLVGVYPNGEYIYR